MLIMETDAARIRMTDLARVRGFAGATEGSLVAPLELQRIDGGYLGGIDHPDGSTVIRMHIVDGVTGTLEWPAWPLDVIEQRIRLSSTHDRFPPYVSAVLEASGWHPGRLLPDEVVDAFAAEVAAMPQEEEPIHLHRAAREKVAEFGGLVLPAWRTPVIRVAPVAGYRWVAEDVDVLQEIHGQAFSVVAVGRGGEVVMAEDGWCVVTTDEGRFWGGVTFEDMVVRGLTGLGRGMRFTHSGLDELLDAGPAA
jgi:hypothetical protein